MSKANLEKIINIAWNDKENISSHTDKEIKDAILQTLDLLGNGLLRVAG